MKNNIKALLMGTLFLLSGCALESEIYDKINPSIYPQTEGDLNALVAGSVYSVFSANGYNNFFNAANGFITANEIVSDVMTCTWGNWDTFEFNSYELNHPLVSNNFNEFKYYYRLGGMLLTLDRIENSAAKISDEKKARFIAETKCGIGFMAYLFYDLYGPIVLPDLEALKNPEKDKIIPRATKEEMRTFIETNLTEAAAVLPYRYGDASDYGRFTKGLANTLLLKLYMHEGDWAKAVAIGKELVVTNVDKYGYKIEDDYYKLFSPGGSSSPEVIFFAGSTEGALENNYQAHAYPSDFPADKYFSNAASAGVWGGYRMAWSFYRTYDKNDYRMTRIYGEYESKSTKDDAGNPVVRNEENDRKSTSLPLYWGAVPGKYSMEGVIGEASACDIIVYRFADVTTLYAEALVRSGNSVPSEAKSYLNEIRTKHGKLPAFTDAELSTPEKFLDKMLQERGHEFYMEGVRRQDLIRHDKFIEKALEKAREYGYSTAKIETKENGQYKYLLFPIPQNIMTEGQGKIEQNPGYN